jgi:hypothetical protein
MRPWLERYTQETALQARQMYVDGVRVRDICRILAMSEGALYYWLDGGPATGPRHLEPIPRRSGRQPRARRVGGDRVALVSRIWRTAEAQVREIEHRLKQDDPQSEQRERDVRTLAVLVKALRELTALDERKPAPQAERDDDYGPRDIDEFRRELARRMDALVASRTGGGISRAPDKG